jgi:lipopolysaccharide transport system ATP-binding protein
MTQIAIRVENLGKRYRIGATPTRQQYNTLRESISQAGLSALRAVASPISRIRAASKEGSAGMFIPRREQPTIWALRDISFEVPQGQVLGIIGRNGAGKSTLLKILSRVTEPTEGYAEVHGRVGSLLEVGTGFHPELTGRENTYLNGAILGMKRSEIDKKFDEIVAFSEVEKFIDTPVKRYSSGMYLRLAFAVAAHLEPEILVVDEVLAVGDAEFQRKCLGKMSDVAETGRTVLFVSHNMSAIMRLTQEALVLDKGQLALRAPTNQAVDYYLSAGFTQSGRHAWNPEEIPASAAPFRPVEIRMVNEQGRVVDSIRSTQTCFVEIEYQLSAPITGLRIGLYLLTGRGEPVFTAFDTDSPELYHAHSIRPAGAYVSRCQLPSDLLNEGRYLLGVNASTYGMQRYFHDEQALSFNVDASGAPGTQWAEVRMGPIRPRLSWEIQPRGKLSPEFQHSEQILPLEGRNG